MKRLIFMSLLALLVTTSFTACSNDDNVSTEQSIDYAELPEITKAFIELHFSDASVNLAKKSLVPDADGSIYSVYLSNGFELEFDAEGNWTDVDGGIKAVPVAILPNNINEYVTVNYPNLFVTSIEVKTFGYEVELSSDLDLIFDSQGNFIRINN